MYFKAHRREPQSLFAEGRREDVANRNATKPERHPELRLNVLHNHNYPVILNLFQDLKFVVHITRSVILKSVPHFQIKKYVTQSLTE